MNDATRKLETVETALKALGFEVTMTQVDEETENLDVVGLFMTHKTNTRAEIHVTAETADRILSNLPALRKAFA